MYCHADDYAGYVVGNCVGHDVVMVLYTVSRVGYTTVTRMLSYMTRNIPYVYSIFDM